MFKKWFEVEFHSAVLDLVDAPLRGAMGTGLEI
jgi:hypothetical protein